MAVPCSASVTWFQEPGHVRVDDKCVLDNGHMDYDHLPAGKVAEQTETRVWNAGAEALRAAVFVGLLKYGCTPGFATSVLEEALKEVRRGP